MILKPKDNTWKLPTISDANDLFKYIAAYNEMNFYETDVNGVVINEIPYGYFFIDRLDLVTPTFTNNKEFKYDGFLFVGIPSEAGEDVDNSQFQNIIKELVSKEFIATVRQYIACDFQFIINNIRPLYNSNKYTKATNTTGIEINYSIWI